MWWAVRPWVCECGHRFVGSEDGSLYALASSTGALLWTFKTGAAVEGSPVVAGDGSLFIGSTDHYL